MKKRIIDTQNIILDLDHQSFAKPSLSQALSLDETDPTRRARFKYITAVWLRWLSLD